MGVNQAATAEALTAAARADREAKILAIVVCLASSCIELVTTVDMCTAMDMCGHSRLQWPLWLGIISLLFCCIRLYLFRAKPMDTRFDVHLSFTVTTIWSFGVAFNTSSGGPFTVTNNGYYSSWMALLSAAYFSYLSVAASVRDAFAQEASRQNKSLLVLFVASFVEMAVSADVCNNHGCSSHEAVATAIGLVSLCLVGTHLVLVRMEHPMRLVSGRVLAPVAVILWVIGALNNTSDSGPFTSSCNQDVPAANGYFSTWIAFYASIHYSWAEFMALLPDSREDQKYQALEQGNHDQPYQPLGNDID